MPVQKIAPSKLYKVNKRSKIVIKITIDILQNERLVKMLLCQNNISGRGVPPYQKLNEKDEINYLYTTLTSLR